MKPLTISDLKELVNSIPSKYDDNVALVSDDEECNGFHPLFDDYVCKGEPFSFYNQKTKQQETRDTLIFE